MSSKALTTTGQKEKPVFLDFLGNKAVARMGPGGAIVAVKVNVTLTEEEKHFYSVGSAKRGTGWVKMYSLASDGYYVLNKIVGGHLTQPQTLVLDGIEQNNPLIKRDKDGNIEWCAVRRIFLARTPLGDLVASDATVIMNPFDYFKTDLIAKIGGFRAKGGDDDGDAKGAPDPDLGHVVPEQALTDEDRANWCIGLGAGLTLVVNVKSPNFLKLLKNYRELVRFADRRAATIADRRAMAVHPAIAVRAITPVDGKATVTVVGWQGADESLDAMRQRAVQLAAGKPVPGVTIQAAGVERIVQDAELESLDDEPSGEDTAPPAESPAEPEPAAAPKLASVKPSKPAAEPPPADDVAADALTPEDRARYLDCITAAEQSLDMKTWGKLTKAAGANVATSPSDWSDATIIRVYKASREAMTK